MDERERMRGRGREGEGKRERERGRECKGEKNRSVCARLKFGQIWYA